MAAVYRGHRDSRLTPAPSAVTLGVFDGVHLGHQALLTATLRRAQAAALRALVVTFDPHPAHLVNHRRAPRLLEPVSQRIGRLAALGFAAIVVEPFDPQLAAMAPDTFVAEVLSRHLGARQLLVGEDFRFGRDRSGGLGDLVAPPGMPPFGVHPVAPVLVDGRPVSSSRIRAAVAAGDVLTAARLLGRPFSLIGPVVAGARRGRGLGFPTANVALAGGVAPARGVYAAWAWAEGRWHRAVVNVGTAPTFASDGAARVEAHLLDYAGGSVYGERLVVALVDHLRAEQVFAGAAALVAQIHRDVAAARAALAGPPPDAAVLAGSAEVAR